MKEKNINETFDKVREWAKERGIYETSNVSNQYLKFQEEAGELAKAILKNDKEEIIDALGDSVIVLINLSKMLGYNLEECIDSAYNEIKNRTGKMENGVFKKD